MLCVDSTCRTTTTCASKFVQCLVCNSGETLKQNKDRRSDFHLKCTDHIAVVTTGLLLQPLCRGKVLPQVRALHEVLATAGCVTTTQQNGEMFHPQVCEDLRKKILTLRKSKRHRDVCWFPFLKSGKPSIYSAHHCR